MNPRDVKRWTRILAAGSLMFAFGVLAVVPTAQAKVVPKRGTINCPPEPDATCDYYVGYCMAAGLDYKVSLSGAGVSVYCAEI